MEFVLFLQYALSLVILSAAVVGLSLLKGYLLRLSARLSQKAALKYFALQELAARPAPENSGSPFIGGNLNNF